MFIKLLSVLAVFTFALNAQTLFPEIFNAIHNGDFKKANTKVSEILSSAPSQAQVYELLFARDLMNRIGFDFRKKKEDIIPFIKKYFPLVTDKQIGEWEKLKDLEFKIIDGEKFYFNQAHRNLFRVNEEAKNVKIKTDGPEADALDEFLKLNIPAVVRDYNYTKKKLIKPVTMEIDYTVSVKRGAVPTGEIIRCWLPFPRKAAGVHTEIELIGVNQKDYLVAPGEELHSTIYIEKTAAVDTETVFNIKYRFRSFAQFNGVKFEKAIDNKFENWNELRKYTAERPPHIVFTDEIKKLSAQVVGTETDPVLKVKKIYDWIDDNIPWASAREYSTIPNISSYALEEMHGDCGIQTLLFMTLCRYNGIPAQWQSGWMLQPGSVNLHDWCRINLPGYGWVPVDMSYGKQEIETEREKYFFFGNNDAYHMVVNDDYSAPLFPSKIYPRSETVDFQRGELEWRGGNLYFDQWNYSMDVKYIDENEK